MGRSWGAAKQPNGLARPHRDSQTQLAVLLKTIGLATSAANVCLTRAGGVYSFFINVSIPHSVISSWRAALAEYTLLWLPLSSHLNSPCSPAPSPAPWDSILPRYPPNQERGLLAGLWLNSEEGNLEGSVPAPFMALSHPSSLSLCVTSSETLSNDPTSRVCSQLFFRSSSCFISFIALIQVELTLFCICWISKSSWQLYNVIIILSSFY